MLFRKLVNETQRKCKLCNNVKPLACFALHVYQPGQVSVRRYSFHVSEYFNKYDSNNGGIYHKRLYDGKFEDCFDLVCIECAPFYWGDSLVKEALRKNGITKEDITDEMMLVKRQEWTIREFRHQLNQKKRRIENESSYANV